MKNNCMQITNEAGWIHADNEKAYHEIAANTTGGFVNKELLQELDKTRNASKLEDEDRIVHNLQSLLFHCVLG
jgi:hypothetical protein